MNWADQIGFCPECKAQISMNDFISGGHNVVCKKSQGAK